MVTYINFIVCFETVLAREHSGKVLQNSTASFISEESKKWKTVFCPEIFRVRLHRFSKNNSRDYYNFAFDFCLVIQREIFNISFVFFVPETENYLRQVFMIRNTQIDVTTQ